MDSPLDPPPETERSSIGTVSSFVEIRRTGLVLLEVALIQWRETYDKCLDISSSWLEAVTAVAHLAVA